MIEGPMSATRAAGGRTRLGEVGAKLTLRSGTKKHQRGLRSAANCVNGVVCFTPGSCLTPVGIAEGQLCARNGPVHLQTVRRLICIGVGLALLTDPRWHRRRQAASLDT